MKSLSSFVVAFNLTSSSSNTCDVGSQFPFRKFYGNERQRGGNHMEQLNFFKPKPNQSFERATKFYCHPVCSCGWKTLVLQLFSGTQKLFPFTWSRKKISTFLVTILMTIWLLYKHTKHKTITTNKQIKKKKKKHK